MKFTTIAVLIAALAGFAASIYWSPYHSCVRALVDDGVSSTFNRVRVCPKLFLRNACADNKLFV